MEDQTKEGEKKGGLKGLFSGIGGVTGWFSALLGRPRTPAQTPGQTQPESSSAPQEYIPPEEDSIKKDINSFKSFVGKSFKKVSSKTAPVASQGVEAGAKSLETAKSLVDKPFLKKLVRLFLILVFLLLLIFIAVKLFQLLKENGGVVTPAGVSPTPAPYLPYKPSVWAEDPEILQLEEDINILDRELTNTGLREGNLTPPNLDFNIQF